MPPLRAVHIEGDQSCFPTANAQLSFAFTSQHVPQFQLLGTRRAAYGCAVSLQHRLCFNLDALLHSHCLSHSGSLSRSLGFKSIKMAKLNLQVDQAPGHRAGQTEC